MAGLSVAGDHVTYRFNGYLETGTVLDMLPNLGIAVIERDSVNPSFDAVSISNIIERTSL